VQDSQDDERSAIENRIEKDIRMFNESVAKVAVPKDDKSITRVVDLSRMYASDARSYLDKKDFYTAFSCISYAHGLLDAIKEILQVK
jgi:hypothetical protein